MKRILTLFFVVFIALIYSCKSEDEKASGIMISQIKKHIEDSAFKDNVELEIYEFDFLGYDTIDNTFPLKVDRIFYDRKIKAFESEIEELKAEMEEHGKKMVDAAVFGTNNPLSKLHEGRMHGKIASATKLYDSIYHYLELDSIAEVEIEANENPAEWYFARVFFKATAIEKNGASENIMDTIRYVFDENKKLVK